MNRITRTLMLAALALALPLASLAGNLTQASATPKHAAKAPTTETKAPATHPMKMKVASARWVDLNEATRDQLMQLAGINDSTADAIVAGRPYTAKAQLLDRKIVDAKTYKKISRFLSLKAPATPPAGH